MAAHQSCGGRLGELGGAAVLGSRPVNCSRRRHNHAFVADSSGIRDVHTKSYFPDEESFWAGSWYQAGAQLIVTPRCTPSQTLDKWLAGGRACATIAGAFSLRQTTGCSR